MTAARSSAGRARSPTDEYPRRPRDPRRTGARILDTAEGVLAALCRCRVDRAFVELMQTAKHHGVNPVDLADALVAIAENQLASDIDGAAAAVARATWGHLLDVNKPEDAAAEGGTAFLPTISQPEKPATRRSNDIPHPTQIKGVK